MASPKGVSSGGNLSAVGDRKDRALLAIQGRQPIEPQTMHELRFKLDGFYGRRVQTPKELAQRNWLTANLGLKLLAAATACGLWFLFAYDVEMLRRTFRDVPIELRQVA